MREIKFRGLNGSGEWIFGGALKDSSEKTLICHPLGDNKALDFVVQESVGQFIGLQDHTGKDIFEGDIVQVSFDNVPDEYFHEVVYMADNYSSYPAFELKGFECESNSFSYILNAPGCSLIIVGNIHKNPELLK